MSVSNLSELSGDSLYSFFYVGEELGLQPTSGGETECTETSLPEAGVQRPSEKLDDIIARRVSEEGDAAQRLVRESPKKRATVLRIKTREIPFSVLQAEKSLIAACESPEDGEAYRPQKPFQDPLPEIPADSLNDLYGQIERRYGAEDRYAPFLRDAQRLAALERGMPLCAAYFLRTLFFKVLAGGPFHGGLTALEGSLWAARLLYILDHHLPAVLSGTFEEACQQVQRAVEEDLRGRADRCEHDQKVYEECCLYDSLPIKEMNVPLYIAKTLIRPDGTMNLGISDLIKKTFFGQKADRGHVENHITGKLRELRANPRLVSLLESIAPPAGANGRLIVNAMLLNFWDRDVSPAEARSAVLAAFLTWWRQHDLENCYVVAAAIQRQEACSEWILRDFKDLVENGGVIARNVDGRRGNFFGFLWAQRLATDVAFSLEHAEGLYQCAAVQHGLSSLDITTLEEFKERIELWELENPEEELTLKDLFERCIEKKERPSEAMERACFLVESPGHNPLFRVWENAMGSMLLLSMSDTAIPVHVYYSSEYYSALFRACADFAKTRGFTKLTTTIKNLMRRKWPNDASLTVPAGSMPKSLQRLRAALVPESVHDTGGLSWVLFEEREGESHPFSSREQLASFLGQIFSEWASIAEKRALSKKRLDVCRHFCDELLTMFERHLLTSKASEHFGMVHGMPVCSMDGGLLSGVLEQEDCVFSEPVKMELGSVQSTAIRTFLAWTTSIRKQYGGSPGISFIGFSKEHAFRLLPNHPSIVEAIEQSSDVVADREQYATRMAGRSHRYPMYYVQKLSELFSEIATKFFVNTECLPSVHHKKIPELIQSKFQDLNEHSCSVKKFLEVSWGVLTTVAKIQSVSDEVVKRIQTYFILSALVRIIPDYQKQFLHFADTNWRCTVGKKTEALHYCFWFDPMQRTWEVIDIAASGSVVEEVEKEEPSFLDRLELHPNIESMSREIQRRTRAESLYKTANALQKIERKFVLAWEELKTKIRESKHASDPLSALSFPSHSPWETAVRACELIRREYSRVSAEQRRSRSPKKGEVRSKQSDYSDQLQQLLVVDDDRFAEEVQGLVSQEGVMIESVDVSALDSFSFV